MAHHLSAAELARQILANRITTLEAAIQTWHDTRFGAVGTPGNRAVLAPPDIDLLEAAGVAHRRLGPWDGGIEAAGATEASMGVVETVA